MKKSAKLNLIVDTVIFILGFLPWMRVNGENYQVLDFLIRGFSGELGKGGVGNPFFIWAVVVLASYSIYPVLCYRILRGKDRKFWEGVSLYLGTMGIVVFYLVLEVMLIATEQQEVWVPYQITRSGIIIIWFLSNRRISERADRHQKKAMQQPEKGKSYQKPVRWFYIFTSMMAAASILFMKWVYIGERGYTVTGFLIEVNKYGGFIKYFSKTNGLDVKEITGIYGILLPSCYMLYLLLTVAVLCVIRSVLLYRSKKSNYIANVIYGLTFIIYFVYLILPAYMPGAAFFVVLISLPLQFLGGLYLEQRKEIKKRAANAREKAILEKEEKKQRLYFPGRYSWDFFQVVWKNFSYNRRNYMLLWGSGAGVSGVLYAILSARELISVKNEAPGGDMMKILEELLPAVIFFSVLIIALAGIYYFQIRTRNYQVYHSLGIRKKTLGIIIALEYTLCFLGSLFTGIIILSFFIYLLLKIFGLVELGRYMCSGEWAGVIGKTAGIFSVIVLIAVLINYHLLEGKSLVKPLERTQKDERIPGHFLLAGIAAGLAVIIFAVIKYRDVYQEESFVLSLGILFGTFILLCCLSAKVIRAFTKEEDRHEEKLLNILPWRHRFATNFRFWYLLSAFNILAGMVYIPQFAAMEAAENPDRLYPYDFVCMAYEDDNAYFHGLQETYDLQIKSYPMIRVTTPLGEKYSWKQAANNSYVGTLWPQGQHIGIPESVYNELTDNNGDSLDKQLDLKGSEVHVVFQQDASVKAHPLEWYSGMEWWHDDDEIRFKTGQPVRQAPYASRTDIFLQYKIKSSEKNILTGMFAEGKQENIIVFSDEYFRQCSAAEGPTSLKLLKCKKEDYEAVRNALAEFSQKHIKDSSWDEKIQACYEKNKMISLTDSERFMKKILYMTVVFMLLISNFLVFHIKYGMEREQRAEQSALLSCLGMPAEEQKKILWREMGISVCGSCFTALTLSLPVVLSIVHIRMFTAGEKSLFFKCWIIFIVVHLVIYAGILISLQSRQIRTILRKDMRR